MCLGILPAWHTHPLGQTLIVTAGCGRAQRWGAPAEEIRPGDVISIRPQSNAGKQFAELDERLKKTETADWLQLDAAKRAGKVLKLPTDTDTGFQTELVVDFYSR